MTNPKMMNSGRPRIKDDDYKTVDPRCVLGLLEHFNDSFSAYNDIIDPCAPTGSGIISALHMAGKHAKGEAKALADHPCFWVVSNPPYKRPLVDQILERQIDNIERRVIKVGVALLLRTNFDHAKGREKFFKHCPYYYGQIKLLFRPRWFEVKDGDKTPFHNFVWHIWTWAKHDHPIVMYSEGK